MERFCKLCLSYIPEGESYVSNEWGDFCSEDHMALFDPKEEEGEIFR